MLIKKKDFRRDGADGVGERLDIDTFHASKIVKGASYFRSNMLM